MSKMKMLQGKITNIQKTKPKFSEHWMIVLFPTIASPVTSETTTELSVLMLYLPGRNFNVVLEVKYTLVLCMVSGSV